MAFVREAPHLAEDAFVNEKNLGRMTPVELREIWANEAGEFTPWLAQDENLALLAETIGLDLECEGQEQNVGLFRADILCRDTATGDFVLIENQLERTDHMHLGQLLTYAAGLKAVTIVWIADKFTDEHRAALDWLNEITGERFGFFGLEIELWRIGESLTAPKFNIVCKPNDWVRRPGDTGPSETAQLYREYWTALSAHLETSRSFIRMGKPQPQMWMTFPLGRGHFYLTTAISKKKRFVNVQLVLTGSDRLAHFYLLRDRRDEIHRVLGPALGWRELPDGKESHVRRVFPNVDPADMSDWSRQHETIRTTLETFHKLFAPMVKELDAAEYEAPDAAAQA